MNATVTATLLSAQDLDRLEALLGSLALSGDALPLDMLQGLLFAVAAGPHEIPAATWFPAALGEAPQYRSDDEAQETRELVLRFHDQCRADAAADDFALLVYRDEHGTEDLQAWCAGYLDGVDLAEPAWHEAGDPDDVDELLFPFIVLAGELPEEERRHYAPSAWSELVESCQEGIGDAIIDVRDYWQAVRNRPTTIRRETPKTGRNAPCPCGSGRKFKQCCGAPGRLQ